MAKWRLCFFLLLPLTACSNTETHVKISGSEPYVWEICTNSTLNIITLIVCKIRTELSRGEECRLLYQHGLDFVNKCDSRFALMMESQTVFLHLTSLTPVDSGNVTCECSHPDGTNILHLNVTVEEAEDSSSPTQMPVQSALIGLTVIIIITGVILGLIHRRRRHGKQPESLSGRPNLESQDIEPYSTFIQRENGLYSTVRLQTSNTNNSNMFT